MTTVRPCNMRRGNLHGLGSCFFHLVSRICLFLFVSCRPRPLPAFGGGPFFFFSQLPDLVSGEILQRGANSTTTSEDMRVASILILSFCDVAEAAYLLVVVVGGSLLWF